MVRQLSGSAPAGWVMTLPPSGSGPFPGRNPVSGRRSMVQVSVKPFESLISGASAPTSRRGPRLSVMHEKQHYVLKGMYDALVDSAFEAIGKKDSGISAEIRGPGGAVDRSPSGP